jgi:hypothetical protein
VRRKIEKVRGREERNREAGLDNRKQDAGRCVALHPVFFVPWAEIGTFKVHSNGWSPWEQISPGASSIVGFGLGSSSISALWPFFIFLS